MLRFVCLLSLNKEAIAWSLTLWDPPHNLQASLSPKGKALCDLPIDRSLTPAGGNTKQHRDTNRSRGQRVEIRHLSPWTGSDRDYTEDVPIGRSLISHYHCAKLLCCIRYSSVSIRSSAHCPRGLLISVLDDQQYAAVCGGTRVTIQAEWFRCRWWLSVFGLISRGLLGSFMPPGIESHIKAEGRLAWNALLRGSPQISDSRKRGGGGGGRNQ